MLERGELGFFRIFSVLRLKVFVRTPLRHLLWQKLLRIEFFTSKKGYFQVRSFIHEVGATVECTLDAIPAMDETSHILNLLAQGLRLDSRTIKS